MPLVITPDIAAKASEPQDVFKLPFLEQIAFFRAKLNLPTEFWDDILKAAHNRAFVVAGATKAELLTDLNMAVTAAIQDGETISAFRKRFDEIVAKHGWSYNGERDWRSRIIYQTNLSSSYSAGRWAQLHDPDLLKSRPYWEYIHNDNVSHPRPLHLQWSGTVLSYDDPWWKTHFTPNGWGCRCRIAAVTADQYPGLPAPNNGTYIHTDRNGEVHTIPEGIDYGWDYAPGTSAYQPDLSRYPKPIAKALAADMAGR